MHTNTQKVGVDPAGAFAPAQPRRPHYWLSWAALATDVAATASLVWVVVFVLGGR